MADGVARSWGRPSERRACRIVSQKRQPRRRAGLQQLLPWTASVAGWRVVGGSSRARREVLQYDLIADRDKDETDGTAARWGMADGGGSREERGAGEESEVKDGRKVEM